MNQVLSSDSRHFCPSQELACELMQKYGSPLYVYDAGHLRKNIDFVESSVRYPNKQFAFAAVTNGNTSLLKIFKAKGWGLHANTPGDAYLGLAAGFNPAEIIYSGSNLSRLEMELMLSWGIRIFNLDSIDQLRSLAQAVVDLKLPPPKIGFRLNLPSITGESRIGIAPESLPEASQIAREYGLNVSGIHFYRGTSTNATVRFVDSFEAVLKAAQFLERFEYLDFGGGFGFPYQDRRHSFDWTVFSEELEAALSAFAMSPRLIIEPGRSIIAGSASLLCTVISTKWQADKQLVGVDTTTSNIAVLSVHGGIRQVRVLDCARAEAQEIFQSDVCGNSTYSRDYISRSCSLPRLKAGDRLAILDTGAYGYSMSSHFLHRPRPAEVLLDNGSYKLVRQKESWQCLLTNQMDTEFTPPSLSPLATGTGKSGAMET